MLAAAIGKAEIARHREIICKTVGGILLILLKALKLVRTWHTIAFCFCLLLGVLTRCTLRSCKKFTDVLAFEYGSRIAVENNTILMLLRFLNQDMAQYTTTITEIAPYRYASKRPSLGLRYSD